jgi:hypothetical protein
VALLRASSSALGGADLDVVDALGSGCGVPHGPTLLAFVDALEDDAADLPTRRAAVLAAFGEAGLVEACLTVSAFNGLTRVADGTGIRLDDGTMAATTDLRAALRINDFVGAESSGDAVHVSAEPVLPADVRSLFS